MSTEDTWFFLGAEDEQCGPVTRAELMKLVLQGHVPDGALVWRPGYDGWRPVRDVEELRPEGSEKPAEKKAETTPTTAAVKQLLGQAQQPAPKTPAPKTPVKPGPQPKAPAPAPSKPAARRDRTPVAVGAVFAVVAVAAVAAMYRYSNPARSAPPAAPPPPVVAQAEMEIPAEVPPEPPVVRVKNPFDASEVFEFPPGTPPHVARDKVADILMTRAMERQKYLEKRTRTTKRR